MVKAAGAEVALPSFSMAQLAKRWAVSLDVIEDYLKTGVLKAYLLLNNMSGVTTDKRGRLREVELNGHYRVASWEVEDVITTLSKDPRNPSNRAPFIILEEPDHTAEPDRQYSNEVFRSKLRIIREEVERFEREHLGFGCKDEKPPAPLRDNQRHRERCRAIAQLLWEHEPVMTIEAMIDRPEITRVGQQDTPYDRKTLRNWIKDLCPNPRPGRPRKLP
jgi:hypothetical protein